MTLPNRPNSSAPRGGHAARRVLSMTLFLGLFLIWALASSTALAQVRFDRQTGPHFTPRFLPAPAAPTLVAPNDGFQVRQRSSVSFTQRLEWTPPTGNPRPDTYKIVLEEQGNPSGFVARASVSPGSGSGNLSHDMILSPRYAGKVISWRVEACSRNQCTASASRTIRWTTRPSVPMLRTPAAGATAPSRTPRFEWRDVQGASSYRLCVHRSGATCTTSPTQSANLIVQSRNGSFGAPDLSAFAGQTIFWTAAACNSAGQCSNFASPRQLAIPQLQPPQLVRPAVPFIADFQQVRFEWRAPSQRPDFYTLCVAAPSENCNTNAPFKRARIRNGVRVDLSIGDLMRYAGTTPNWTVGSCDASGCVWAGPRPIQIPAVPTVPVLSAPMDGYAHASRSNPLPAMSWSVVPDATRYEFCTFRNGQSCATPIRVDANRTSCSFQGGYLADGHHHWTVRACNGAWGCSNFATTFSFHMPASQTAGAHSVGYSTSSGGGGRSGGSVRAVAGGYGGGVCR